MVSTSTACMGLAAAMGVGTLYVLLHEKKRKRKKLEQHAKDQPISKEMLLKILHKAPPALTCNARECRSSRARGKPPVHT